MLELETLFLLIQRLKELLDHKERRKGKNGGGETEKLIWGRKRKRKRKRKKKTKKKKKPQAPLR